MLFGTYRFLCELETPAILPPYKGSTFRGVFGHALKSVVCAIKNISCDKCIVAEKCLYQLVFETNRINSSSPANAAPHPFVIQPDDSTQTRFSKGDIFEFNLLIFGEFNQYLPYFIYAFEHMGRIGVGRRINGKRGRFVLKEVRALDQVVYTDDEKEFFFPENIPTISCRSKEHETADALTIHFKTPLRVKYRKKFNEDLPFHVFVRAMLRRVSTLMETYGEGEPDLDYKGMVLRAEKVRKKENTLSWQDWRRYSNRQQEEMMMGGVMGSVTYEGDIGEYMPLVRFCERTHMGKQTAFGLGRIAVG